MYAFLSMGREACLVDMESIGRQRE